MPKLPNETDHEYKKRVIDSKSASFCAAKWYNATIWLGSGQSTSCHHPPSSTVLIEDLRDNPKALHNTSAKKLDRKMMQQGERPPGCEYCWKLEDAGAASDRVHKTVLYSDEDLNTAFKSDPAADVDLQTLEIAFDRTCQLACSYCNPAFSTSWVRDIKNNGPYKNLESDGRNHFTHAHGLSQLFGPNDDNPYVEAFFKWWESDLHETLKELRITGGEPMMSPHLWRLIDWFKSNRGKSKTRLAINTNLGYEREKLEKLLTACEGLDLSLYTSNESWGRHAEYIRDGLDWNQWIDNVTWLLDSGKLPGLHIMCTINALSLFSLTDLLWHIVELKKKYGKDAINFTLNILRFPSFQSPLVLPKDFRKEACRKLAYLHSNTLDGADNILQEFERSHINRLITYLNEVDSPHYGAVGRDILQRDFKNFYEQYDQRRGKNFTNTFPELKDWYATL